MSKGQANGQEKTKERVNLGKVNHDKLNHDIRASIAITNGFNQALESSFAELSESIRQLQRSDCSSVYADEETKSRIEQLETDCRFCLSRISRSLQQLETRIDSDSRLNSKNTALDRLNSL